MAILGCLISGVIIGRCRKISKKVFYISVALGAWFSVVGAAIFCALELSLSGTSPLKVVLPAMVAIHAVIGAFEGFITIIALRFVAAVNHGFIQIYNGGKL